MDEFGRLVNDHLSDGWVVVPNTSIGYCKSSGESSYSYDRLAIVVEKENSHE